MIHGKPLFNFTEANIYLINVNYDNFIKMYEENIIEVYSDIFMDNSNKRKQKISYKKDDVPNFKKERMKIITKYKIY